MFRTIAGAVAALLLLLTLPAHAGTFTDDFNRFTLSAPEGWEKEPSPAPEVALVIASPRKPETRGNCNVVVSANQLLGKTQAEIDQEASGMINEKFWKAMFGQIKALKSTTIDKWGSREQGGRKVFYVQATSDAEVSGNAFSVTQLQNVHVLPGQTFIATCTALAASFATESSDFDAIMASLEPRPDMTVASVRWSINLDYLREATARKGSEAAMAGVVRTTRR